MEGRIDKYNPVLQIDDYSNGEPLRFTFCDSSTEAPEYSHVGISLGEDTTGCPGGVLPGVSRADNVNACYNKGHRDHLASVEECAAECFRTDGCKSFDYQPNAFNRRCHLCDSVSPNSKSTCDDGVEVWYVDSNCEATFFTFCLHSTDLTLSATQQTMGQVGRRR